MSRNILTNFYCVHGSDIVGDHWGDSPKSMLPIYQELIAAGIRIWVYRYVLVQYLSSIVCT